MPETRYRTLECDGIVTRQQVLVIRPDEWQKLHGHLTRRANEAAHVEHLRHNKRAVKDKSEELKATWKNTQANIREKLLQGRAERLAAKEAHRVERSLEMQQIRADERKMFLNNCKKLMDYKKDDFKTLNTALVLSETLRERAAQLEIEKELDELQAKKDQMWVDRMKADVKAFEAEQAKKKEARRAFMLEHKYAVIDQAKKVEEQKTQEFNTERALEVTDLVNMHNDIERGVRLERENVERQRAKVRENVRESVESAERDRIERQLEEEEEDKTIAILGAAKERIEKKRRDVIRDANEKVRLRREKIAGAIAGSQKAKEDKEDARILKTLAEREALEIKSLQAKEAKAKKLVAERIQDYKEYCEKEALHKEVERQLYKWDMLERFKSNEVNKEFVDAVERKREEKVIATRESRLEEIEARKLALIEYDEEPEAWKAKWQAADDEFLTYADSVTVKSKEKGRPLYPIHKVVLEYKLTNGLLRARKGRRFEPSKVAIGSPPSDLCVCHEVQPQNVLA